MKISDLVQKAQNKTENPEKSFLELQSRKCKRAAISKQEVSCGQYFPPAASFCAVAHLAHLSVNGMISR